MRRLADLTLAVFGYLVGSIPVGLWLGKLRGVDVRNHGSGASGATNVYRTLGREMAAATFALDVAKGAAAVGLARATGAGDNAQAVAGIAAVVGHSWPMLADFRGGKSVATAFGGLLLISPRAATWAVVGGVTTLATTRIVSLSSLAATGAAVAGAATTVRRGDATQLFFTASVATVILVRHRSNLRRIIKGKEGRI